MVWHNFAATSDDRLDGFMRSLKIGKKTSFFPSFYFLHTKKLTVHVVPFRTNGIAFRRLAIQVSELHSSRHEVYQLILCKIAPFYVYTATPYSRHAVAVDVFH